MKKASIATTVFLIVVFSFLTYQRMHKPRVFILHSYAKSMPWVQSLNQGVKQVFEDNPYVSIRYFYMDTKRLHSRRYFKRISRLAINAIDSWKPDILIAFDNNAQMLVGDRYTHHEKMKIIFAGITDNEQLYHYEVAENVTGVVEQIPVNAIREVMSLVFHHKKRIYYLSDNSNTAKNLLENIVGSDWGSHRLVEHKMVKTFDQWKDAVNEAQGRADIILVSVYHTIKQDGHPVDPKHIVRWMDHHSKIPVVGIYESFIIDGGWIAIAVSSIEQGYSAAWLALNAINKKITLANMPFIRSKSFKLYLNKSKVLTHFPYAHIPLILDVFSRDHWSLEDFNPNELNFSHIDAITEAKSGQRENKR